MQINNFFDRIYVINLEAAIGRRLSIKKQAIKVGFQPYFFNAYDKRMSKKYLKKIGKNPKQYTKSDSWWARLGCKISHIECIRDAMKNKFKRILVLEDDVLFKDGFNKEFYNYVNHLPNDWVILLLGYFIKDKTRVEKQNVSYKINEYIYTLTESHGAHAVCYNLESKNLIKYMDVFKHHFYVFKHYDLEMHEICNEIDITRYCVYPQHMGQIKGLSYINNRDKDWELEYDNPKYDLIKSGTVYTYQWHFVKKEKIENGTECYILDNFSQDNRGIERKAVFNNGYFIIELDSGKKISTDKPIYVRYE